MAFTPFNGSGGGGASSDDCTATTAQWRNGYTAIGLGTNDEPSNGGILDYAGASAFTPSTSAQTVPVGGTYSTANITINAIPNQKSDSGNTKLTSSLTNVSYVSGWYNNAHGAYVDVFTW